MPYSPPFVYCRVGGADPADPGANVDGVVPVTALYPRNAVLSAGIGDGNLGNTSGNPLLPNWIGHFWGPGAVVKVGFLSGSNWQKGQVQSIASQWSQYANVTLDFPSSAPFDVTVDFKPELANFSLIGSHALWVSGRGATSMNLGSVQPDAPAPIRRAVILQVFGLALGLTHVYPSKISDIPWNKAAVYKDLASAPLGWTQKEVDGRVFVAEDYAAPHDVGDRKSIMQYAFSPDWVTSGKSSSWGLWGSTAPGGSPWNLDISEGDKDLLRFYYPFDEVNDAQHFQSMEKRHWNAPAAVTTSERKLIEPWGEQHRFLYGLTLFDLDNEKNFRLKTSITNVGPSNFTAKMDSWSDSINYLSGMTFLELKAFQSAVQTGIFNTSETRRWQDVRVINNKRINFATPFDGPAPKVVTWITGMDFANSKNIRIKSYATKIDNKGFTCNIDSWSDSIFYEGECGWVAIPGDATDMAVGSVNTQDVRPWNKVIPDTSNAVKFPVTFTKRPRMFFALNHLDMSKDGTWCCRSALEYVTPTYFKWNFQSWWTTALYSAGASYFAFNP